jgi:hypothetical protein
MRDELAETAKEAATKAREVASTGAHEVATRAREVAASAGEWVPIFQRPEGEESLNGDPIVDPIAEAIDTSEITPPTAARKRTPKPTAIDEVE